MFDYGAYDYDPIIPDRLTSPFIHDQLIQKNKPISYKFIPLDAYKCTKKSVEFDA